jgi:hypothetical protein
MDARRRCAVAYRAICVGAAADFCYSSAMAGSSTEPGKSNSIWRAIVEIAFIVFLFYSNLLMGEFTQSHGQGKSFAFAVRDIFSATNFAIAVFAALVGYVVFEHLRKKL